VLAAFLLFFIKINVGYWFPIPRIFNYVRPAPSKTSDTNLNQSQTGSPQVTFKSTNLILVFSLLAREILEKLGSQTRRMHMVDDEC